MDRVDEMLAIAAFPDNLRVRLSGLIDLRGILPSDQRLRSD